MVNGVDRQYTDEIYDETGYLATWQPGAHIELGDCGPLEHHLCSHVNARSRTSASVSSRARKGSPIDVDFASKDGVSVTIQLEGENKGLAPQIPPGKAGIDIKFTRKGAVVMQLREAVERSVADLYQLQRDVLSYFKRNRDNRDKWPENYAVVSSIVEG